MKTLKTSLIVSLLLSVVTVAVATVSAQRRRTPTRPAQPTPAPQRSGFTNSIGMEFVKIPAGSFLMGSDTSNCPPDDPFTTRNERQECVNRVGRSEMPRHRVTISQAFYMGKYEVTQEQWYKVMGNNPSKFKSEEVGGDSRRHPVEQVSWHDAQAFIRRLNEMEPERTYRLPTEAEWEYACRAGTTGDYAGNVDSMAWHHDNSGGRTHPVGQKQPNAFGLYDMHGNVWEWCEDDWHGSYDGAPDDGRAWVDISARGSLRVYRGGSWYGDAVYCRSAFRNAWSLGYRVSYLGFRLLRTYR